MTRTVVFSSYEAEIPWAARLAELLKAHGFAAEIWIFNDTEREKAAATGAFANVVDLTAGFDRRRIGDEAAVLKRARALEERLGERFLHRDSAGDRRLTGFDQIEIPRADIAHRWTWPQLAALAVHVDEAVAARFAAAKPLAVMVEPVLMPERLICRLVKEAGVRLLIPSYLSYLPDRIYFTERLDAHWPEWEAHFAALEREPIPADARAVAEAAMETIRATSTMPQRREGVSDYLPSAWERLGPGRVTKVVQVWRTARADSMRGSPHSSYPELVTPWARVRRKVERYRVRRGFDRWARRAIPDGRYAAYFLHSQPEVTVEGWAFDLMDQIALVRNIVASLPADMVLAVKEHRIQAGLRDPAFYEELLSIPGVVLTHDSVDPRDFISRASVVLTLTGTVTLEAMCLGTPAIVFGEIYYEQLPGVRRARTIPELRALLTDVDALPVARDEDVVRALAARYLASYEAGWRSGGRSPADESTTVRTLLELFNAESAEMRATTA